MVSLGQGQGPYAVRLIEEACKTGGWVCLQNCHLARSWMPQMEKVVDNIAETEDQVHEDFRLFLTSMPAPYFPVPVLQNGVKLTNEPHKGIRANVLRSLATLNNWEPFEECTGENGVDAWKTLAFGACFFHATVQERRKFGPLGWNILYEFNDSDLESSILVLKMFLQEQPNIPYDALLYVTGQINYGGRVTDDWDRRCLMSILHNFYTPQVFEDCYKFSASGKYYTPSPGPLSEYTKYVEASGTAVKRTHARTVKRTHALTRACHTCVRSAHTHHSDLCNSTALF